MCKTVAILAILLLSFQATFSHENDLKPKEKLTVSVQIVEEEDSQNGPNGRKTEVKVFFVESLI